MYIHVYACIYANAYFLGHWPRLIFSASSPNSFSAFAECLPKIEIRLGPKPII